MSWSLAVVAVETLAAEVALAVIVLAFLVSLPEGVLVQSLR
jgi:hypothetical protein